MNVRLCVHNAGNGGAGVRAFVQRLTEYRGYGFEWWCPVARTMEQAGGACLRKIKGHKGGVLSVSFSPDGTRIVSGSYDKTVRVWDALSGQCVRVVEGTSAVPADIPVAIASCAERDLSRKQVDAPAGGADFSDCRVHGSRACARAGKIVHVLRLMPI